jgi:hypothetical protein
VQRLLASKARAVEAAAAAADYVQPVTGQQGVFRVAKSERTVGSMLHAAMVDGTVSHSTTLLQYKEQLQASQLTYR